MSEKLETLEHAHERCLRDLTALDRDLTALENECKLAIFERERERERSLRHRAALENECKLAMLERERECELSLRHRTASRKEILTLALPLFMSGIYIR